jgi:ubiquitin carboxyl-terminal hydrolase 9/24
MVNEVIGKECSHVSEQEEAFIAISLTVKSKKTIQQSLQSVIKGDTLEGDNAYHCEKCDKKVNAVKRMCIKRLPP